MRVYKSRNDVLDDNTELVNKEDLLKSLEDIRIVCVEGSGLAAVDNLLNSLKGSD